MPASPPRPLAGRAALVTGANHGIGAATAAALARLGAHVAVTYRRMVPAEGDDPGRPTAYDRARSRDDSDVAAELEAVGARWISVEADLTEPDTPSRLFDEAEAALGAVTILVNNASGWRKDTFVPEVEDRFHRAHDAVSAATFDAQFHVDACAGALLIAELARRHIARDGDWGRIVSLTSGGALGFPSAAL